MPVIAAGNDDVSILMVGDILLHDPVESSAEIAEGDYDFDFIFEDLKDEISGADLAMVNQEVIIGGKDLGVSGYPAFNAPYEIGDALVHAGFDVICHATNHALDKGKKGIVNTCSFWSENYPRITVLGINASKKDYDTVRIVTQKGIKIAILNYTYGTNGIKLPADMPYAVNLLDLKKVIADLQYAEENADFTIVCPHWGTEYNLQTDAMQQKWAQIFWENGADLVIGTHPHVIEAIEQMEDDKPGISNNHGNGDMLVYYSLGNYVNWTSGKGDGVANRMVGGMAEVTIGKNDDGETVIKDHGIRAIVCHVESGKQGVHVYPLRSYTDEMGRKNEIVKQDPSFSTRYCKRLCENVWGSYR